VATEALRVKVVVVVVVLVLTDQTFQVTLEDQAGLVFHQALQAQRSHEQAEGVAGEVQPVELRQAEAGPVEAT